MELTEEEFDTLVFSNCAGPCSCDECKRIKEKQDEVESKSNCLDRGF
jgi:hypothetical protein